MAKPVVHLADLKRALQLQPSSLIRGLGLTNYNRGNVDPASVCPSEHARFVAHDNGLIVVLWLKQGPSKAEVLQRLLLEPDTLVLAVNVGSNHFLARKLRLDCGAANVEIKLHESNGLPALYFDEVPELLALNDTNADWCIEQMLKGLPEASDQTAHALIASQPQLRLYAIVDPNGQSRCFVSERKARAWLPKLPDKLEPLIRTTAFDRVFVFCATRDSLFALFGNADTYLAALQRARQ